MRNTRSGHKKGEKKNKALLEVLLCAANEKKKKEEKSKEEDEGGMRSLSLSTESTRNVLSREQT